MNVKNKLSIFILAVAIIIVGGGIAEQFNKHNHFEMALNECGSKENIKYYNSKGFECISKKSAAEAS